MKNCFLLTGFAVLSLGMAMVSCSSTDVYDENFAKNAADNQRIGKYEEAFTQAFGQVNKNHKWGFDQTTGIKTRQAITESTQVWEIPENLWGGAQNKEGWNANDLGENKVKENEEILANAFKEGTVPSTSLTDFSFNNYFLQHVEQPNGGNIKNSIERLEAYNSTTGKWETVTNFSAGKNNDNFTIVADATYYYGNINRSAKGTTLMADMGGAPDANHHLFRVVEKDGNQEVYNYDYRLIRMDAYHKDLKKTIEGEPFLFFQFPPKNGNKGDSYWVIRLGVAEIIETPIVAEGRVLCEDMGANDFDFNDVVFDAWMYKNGDIKIKILAHGGELDIKVAGVPVELEKMSNTGLKSVATQEFTILAKDHNYKSIADIPVEVFPNGFADNLHSFPLEAIEGKVPQKVCAPVGTNWPDEYIRISNAYTSFTNWVTESNPARWTFQIKPRLVNLNLDDNSNPEQD